MFRNRGDVRRRIRALAWLFLASLVLSARGSLLGDIINFARVTIHDARDAGRVTFVGIMEYVREGKTYAGGGYFLIKNSWGSKWGDMGYARLPYDYCKSNDCYFMETLGVVYAGKTWDGSVVPPPPPPTDDPTANDLQVVTKKDPTAVNKFTLALVERKPGALAKVQRVTYDVHETFKEYRTWAVTEAKDGFVIPFMYTTYWKGRWKTNGAAVQLTSGKILNLSGANVDWFYVDSTPVKP